MASSSDLDYLAELQQADADDMAEYENDDQDIDDLAESDAEFWSRRKMKFAYKASKWAFNNPKTAKSAYKIYKMIY